MKSLEEYLRLPYTIETKRESDGSYFIKVKELPGCMSVGDSIEDAYAMIEDAKADWIQFCLDDGRVVPEPEEEEEVKTYSGKFMVRITPKLHRELAETAEENGVSLNHLVTEMLSSTSGVVKGMQQTFADLWRKINPILIESKVTRGTFKAMGRSEPWSLKGMNSGLRDS